MPATRPIKRLAAAIVLAGAVVLAAGAYMPWTIATDFYGVTHTFTGMQGDGILLAGLSGAIGVIGVVLQRRPAGRRSVALLWVFAILAGAIAAFDLFNVTTGVATVNASSDLVQAQMGIGLYVAGFGVLVTAIGAAMAWPRGQDDEIAIPVAAGVSETAIWRE
jgi:hypothetical protein